MKNVKKPQTNDIEGPTNLKNVLPSFPVGPDNVNVTLSPFLLSGLSDKIISKQVWNVL